MKNRFDAGRVAGLLLFGLCIAGSAVHAATFIAGPSFSGGRNNQTATLLPDGRLFVCGSGVGTALWGEFYDPAANVFTPGPVPVDKRSKHTATLLTNGKVLLVGGLGSSTYLTSVDLFNPADNSLTPVAALPVARASHTANILANGKVLIAGGQNSSGVLSSALLYDPVLNKWSDGGTMSTPHAFHAAVTLLDATILVIGGFNSSGVPNVERYNAATNSWTAAPSMSMKRQSPAATLMPNGKVLVSGGGPTHLNTAEIFDPVSNQWSNAASMARARSAHTATLLPNGKILVTGGQDFGTLNNYVATAEVYDVNLGTWSLAPNMTSARGFHSATLLLSGKVIIIGGFNTIGASNNCEFYDWAANDWTAGAALKTPRGKQTATTLPNGKILAAGGEDGSGSVSKAELYDAGQNAWTATGSMSAPRSNHTAVLLSNGKVLVAGGSNGGVLSSAELFDASSNSWSSAGSLAIARAYHTATLLPSGKVLVAGGRDSNGEQVKSAELYDPVANVWTAAAAMGLEREGASATLLPTGKVLVAGGFNGGYLNSAELYDPAANSWSAAASFITPRAFHSVTLLFNGRLMMTGGYNFNYLNAVEIYDPVAGAWSAAPSMAVARAYHGAVTMPSGRVLVAGGFNGSVLNSTELYDPATINGWVAAKTLNVARQNLTLSVLLNQKVFAVGGLTPDATATTELTDDGFHFPANVRPVVTNVNSPVAVGNSVQLSGSLFKGKSEGSSGTCTGSPANYPIVHIRSLNDGQVLRLSTISTGSWTDTSYISSALPLSFPRGFAAVTVYVNSVPSASVITRVTTPTVLTANNIACFYNQAVQTVTLKAAVTSPSGVVGNGTATFLLFDGANPIGSAVTGTIGTDGSVAISYPLPAGFAPGMYAIHVSYPGDVFFAGSTDTAHALTVAPAPTLTAAAQVSVPYAPIDQIVTLTAVVSSDSGAVNGGTIAFAISDHGTPIGSAVTSSTVTDGSASAVYTLPALTALGDYTISAEYSGTANLQSSVDDTHLFTVGLPANVPTVTAAANISAPFGPAQTVTLSATVTPAFLGPIDEGTLTFQLTLNGVPLGNAVTSDLLTNGGASVNYPIPANAAVGVYTISATFNATATYAGSVDSTHTVTLFGPVLTSGPTVSAQPAGVGQALDFTVSASDDFGDELSYAWQFGDGGSAAGPTATYVYATAGVYTATMTITDGHGSTLIATIDVTVLTPALGLGDDSDGDGFSDDFETAAGTDPADAASTPFGTTVYPPAAVDLSSLKLAVKLSFAKPKDSITLSGTVPAPATFSFANQYVTIQIANYFKRSKLDAKGHSTPKETAAFAFAKPKKGLSAFQFKVSGGNYASAFASAGLIPAAPANTTVQIPVTLLFNSTVFKTNVTLLFSGKAGTTKAPKKTK